MAEPEQNPQDSESQEREWMPPDEWRHFLWGELKKWMKAERQKAKGKKLPPHVQAVQMLWDDYTKYKALADMRALTEKKCELETLVEKLNQQLAAAEGQFQAERARLAIAWETLQA